jgi:ethanolamine phosphate phosphodiesterase
MNYKLKNRFDKAFNTDSAQLIRLNGINFVTVNSVTMEGDYCQLCSDAEHKLADIANQLCPQSNCSQHSRPILLTHFPLFRESDKFCDELDSAPNNIKLEKFKQKWDCLSEKATKLLMDSLKPRLIVNGHTHYGCVTFHTNNVQEWTLSSFNWRNTNNPSFLLAKISQNNFVISKCVLPNQITVILIYVNLTVVLVLLWLSKIKRFRIRPKMKFFY